MNFIYTRAITILLLSLFFGITNTALSQNIENDSFWKTKDGKPIYSQGGGIFKFTDPITGAKKYYWYGVNYAEADKYRIDPSVTQPRATFESVTCYTCYGSRFIV